MPVIKKVLQYYLAFILFIGASVGPLLANYIMQIGTALIAFSVFSGFIFFGFILSISIKNNEI